MESPVSNSHAQNRVQLQVKGNEGQDENYFSQSKLLQRDGYQTNDQCQLWMARLFKITPFPILLVQWQRLTPTTCSFSLRMSQWIAQMLKNYFNFIKGTHEASVTGHEYGKPASKRSVSLKYPSVPEELQRRWNRLRNWKTPEQHQSLSSSCLRRVALLRFESDLFTQFVFSV